MSCKSTCSQHASCSCFQYKVTTGSVAVQSGIFGTNHFFALGQQLADELEVTQSTDASDRRAWLIIGYILAVGTAVLILLSLLMMRRIKVVLAASMTEHPTIYCLLSSVISHAAAHAYDHHDPDHHDPDHNALSLAA